MPHPVDTAQRSSIGEGLVKEGLLTAEQLARALRVQALLEQPKMLGEVLVDLGYATKQAISGAIIKHGPGMCLGELLLEQGLVSAEALGAALQMQKEHPGVRLGQILVDSGAISERTLLRTSRARQEVD